MTRILQVLFALLLTIPLAFLGWLLARDPGRLSLRAWGWQIDTTLVLAAALLLLALAAVFALYALLWRLPKRLLEKRQKRFVEQFRLGLTDFFAGDFNSARKRLHIGANAPEFQPIAQLTGGLAASWQDDAAAAQQLTLKAAAHPATALAASIQSDLLSMQIGEVSALERLKQTAQTHPNAQLITQVLGEFQKRHRGLEAVQWIAANVGHAPFKAALKHQGVAALMAQLHRVALSQAHTPPQLHSAWAGISDKEAQQPDLLAAYAVAAKRLEPANGADNPANMALLKTLGAQSSEQLWQAAAQVCDAPGFDLKALKQLATRSLDKNGATPALLLCLAKLNRLNDQANAAQQYLDQALALGASPDAFEEAALLAQKNGDLAAANAHWQSAWQLLRRQSETP